MRNLSKRQSEHLLAVQSRRGMSLVPGTETHLLEVSVLHGLLDGAQRLLEQVAVELLKPRARQRLAQVHAVRQRLNLHTHLKNSLCTLDQPILHHELHSSMQESSAVQQYQSSFGSSRGILERCPKSEGSPLVSAVLFMLSIRAVT